MAAILHLGNIEFEKGEEDSSVVKDDESKFHLQMTAKLLMYVRKLNNVAILITSFSCLCFEIS